MADLLTRIDGVRAGAGPAATPAGDTGTSDFRALLQSLERLVAEHRDRPPVQDAEQLQAAVRAADAGFVTAMDLRKQLEQAFRSRLP